MTNGPYYYPGTDVLRNKQNIRDKNALEQTENAFSALRVRDAEQLPGPPDLTRLKAVHRTLFGDLYEWAGQTRENTGRMTKDRPAGYSVSYGDSAYVEAQLAAEQDRIQRLHFELAKQSPYTVESSSLRTGSKRLRTSYSKG